MTNPKGSKCPPGRIWTSDLWIPVYTSTVHRSTNWATRGFMRAANNVVRAWLDRYLFSLATKGKCNAQTQALQHTCSAHSTTNAGRRLHPLVAQLVERWTVEVCTGIHRSLVQIRPGGCFLQDYLLNSFLPLFEQSMIKSNMCTICSQCRVALYCHITVTP